MGEVRVEVFQRLADEVLDAIPFPLDLQFPPSAAKAFPGYEGELLTASLAEPMEIGQDSITIRPVDGEKLLPSDEAVVIERSLVDMCVAAVEAPHKVDQLSPEDARPLRALLNRITARDTSADGVRDGLTKATDAEFRAMLSRIRFWWETEWVRVTIEHRPRALLAAPIVLSDLRVAVQIRGRVCGTVPIIGTTCTPRFNSPRVPLVGRNLFVNLQSTPPTLSGVLHFDDIDIEICVKIIKWKVCLRIGVTGLVDRVLATRPWSIVNFGSFEGDIPFSKKKLRISNLTPSTGTGGLDVTAALVVTG